MNTPATPLTLPRPRPPAPRYFFRYGRDVRTGRWRLRWYPAPLGQTGSIALDYSLLITLMAVLMITAACT